MSTKTLLSIVIGFTGGIFIRSFVSFSFNTFLILLITISLLLFIWFLFKGNRSIGVIVLLFSIFFSLGYFRMNETMSPNLMSSLNEDIGKQIEITGLVSADPDERENNTKLTIISDSKTKILVSTEPYTEFNYGDKVRVSGILKVPENFETDLGREFDYVNYLSKDGIYFQMSFADVSIISHNNGNFIVRNLFLLKNKFLDKIQRLFPEPDSALLGGLLLGKKQSLGDSLKQDFIDTGLIHIVVLSGFNMTIVGYFFKWLFSRFNRRLKNGLAIGAIILFAIMVGLGATVVRASIMAILALLAGEAGRQYDIGRALIIAGALMLLQNPNVLVFDISFQLSFLATLGMVYLLPHMKRWLSFVPVFGNMREIVGATLSAQIFVLPFLLWSIGNFSIIAPLTNVLVLPIVPYVMGIGFLTVILAFIAFPLALLFGFITFFMLHYIILIVTFFADLPFAAVPVPQFSFLFVVVSYAILGWLCVHLYKRNREVLPVV